MMDESRIRYNVVGLAKLQDSLKATLERNAKFSYNQVDWAILEEAEGRRKHVCQTAACLAGLCVSTRKDFDSFVFYTEQPGYNTSRFRTKDGQDLDIAKEAVKKLVVNPADIYPEWNLPLFFFEEWPDPYRGQLWKALAQQDDEQEVQIAINLLQAIIDNDGYMPASRIQ